MRSFIRAARGWLRPGCACACAAWLGGCSAVGFVGAMIEEKRRHSTKPVEAQYERLSGKTFAVVVSADRSVQAEHPGLVPRLATQITDRLSGDEVGALGVVPAQRILQYQYENPRWAALAPIELARTFGVERLIVIEVQEYRLNDPGNQYLWEGVAAAQISVLEADAPFPDEYAFHQAARVDFPDDRGRGPLDFPREVVTTELSRRLIDRVSWLFYRHQEPYYPEY